MIRGKIVTSMLLSLLMASPLCAVAQSSTRGLAISFWIMLLALLVGFVIWIALYVVVAMMAKMRNRNVALWVLVSILSTPLLAVIILLCVGKSYDSYNEERF